MNIRKNDFVKKADSIYLVKDFRKIGSKYILEYYFKTTKKPTGVLHGAGSRELYENQTEYIKKPTRNEIEIIVSKVKNKHPNFDIENSKEASNPRSNDIDEKNCIKYLKDRGYLVYKQI